MNDKINPNKFCGKRKAFPVSGIANVRRNYLWDKKKQRHIDPPRANKFEVRRLSNSLNKRESKTFASLPECRD